MKTLITAFAAAQLCFAGPLAADLMVGVPGTANPHLADPTVSHGRDPRDGTTPPSISVTPGTLLTFSVSGVTGNFPSGSFGPDADGIQSIYEHSVFGLPGHVSDYYYPLNSLAGVFMPDTFVPRPAALSDDITFSYLSPALEQVFFIGDGLTGTGTGNTQTFVVPADASELFFASIDGHEWGNNAGEFQVNVSSSEITPEQILDNSITWEVAGTHIAATFVPNLSLSLEYAAALLGFDHFNWIQLVTNISMGDLALPAFQDINGNAPSQYENGTLIPFFDPIAGGYAYQGTSPGNPTQDSFPYYWDETFAQNNIAQYTNVTASQVTRHFPDRTNYIVPPQSVMFYDSPSTPSGDRIDFTTALAGVHTDGSAVVLNFAGNGLRWFEQGGHESFLVNTSTPTTGQTYENGFVEPGGFTSFEMAAFNNAGMDVLAPSTVPEPSAIVLLGLGIGCGALRCLRSGKRLSKTAFPI